MPFMTASQELQALIKYIQMNKESDTDWFTIAPEDGGKKWKGKCWCAGRRGRAAGEAAGAARQRGGEGAAAAHAAAGARAGGVWHTAAWQWLMCSRLGAAGRQPRSSLRQCPVAAPYVFMHLRACMYLYVTAAR
jgi:hypothetical protein